MKAEGQINVGLRIKIAGVFALVLFSVLLARLWQLQIMEGDRYRELSFNNRFRTIYSPAPRGMILDRNGQILVKNRPSFSVELVKEDCPDIPTTLAKLSDLTEIPLATLEQSLTKNRKRARFEPQILIRESAT